MDAPTVARDIFCGSVTSKWVTRFLKAGRVKLGHCTIRWWENEVRAWLDHQTEGAA